MNSKQIISFHESSVVSFCNNNCSVNLVLDHVLYKYEYKTADIYFYNIKKICTDSQQTTGNLMATCDGEVLSIVIKDNSAEIIIEWKDFKNHQRHTNYYDLEFDTIKINII